MSAFLNLSGQVFGRLTVTDKFERAGNHTLWHCICECGKSHTAKSNNLRRGNVKSCGCLSREMSSERAKTHGDTGSREFRIWCGMRNRCDKPENNRYEYYGARGIKVCERWRSFANFLEDMGRSPAGTSIDRIDVNGNYEPGNCRWATRKEQMNNIRSNVRYEHEGISLTLPEWASRVGIDRNVISGRLERGIPFREAISPIDRRTKRLIPSSIR